MGRLSQLPPYLFAAIDQAKARARAGGMDLVDLGIGDPDLPTPGELIEVLATAAADPACHRYPAQRGEPALRAAIAAWLARRHGATVDPATQVLTLIGSKEGLGHLPLSRLEEGDNTLVPDVGYPVYGQATLLAGGTPRLYALTAENGFRPDLDELARLLDERTRLVFLNYPHNPTGAVADAGFWRAAVELVRGTGAVLVNDAAYLEVTLDGSRPVSLLAHCDPARDRVIELHSLSKMFNMTGWRIAFAAGHPEVVGDLGRVKESLDSGVFTAVQRVAQYALGERFEPLLAEVLAPYADRRCRLTAALAAAGFAVFPSPATFYVWARVPGGGSSLGFCARALAEIGVVMTPGVGFGPGGEGWFRLSLTAADERIDEGARRLEGWR